MRKLLMLVAALTVLFAGSFARPGAIQAQSGTTYSLGSWELREFIQPQPACTGLGYVKELFSRRDCGFGHVTLTSSNPGSSVAARRVYITFVDASGTKVDNQVVQTDSAGVAEFNITPGTNWRAGKIRVRAVTAAPTAATAETSFTLNPLEISILSPSNMFKPGQAVQVQGEVSELDSTTCCLDQREPVPAKVVATLHAPNGAKLAGPVTVQAADDGTFTLAFPGSATATLKGTSDTNFEVGLAVRAQAIYDDPTPFVAANGTPSTSGQWAGSGAGAAVVLTPPSALMLENAFVSSVGWVKPGDTYPFRIIVKNFTPSAAANAVVTIPPVDGTTFTKVAPLNGAGSAAILSNGSIRWTISSIPAASGDTPVLKTLVVEARADTTTQDPEIVWKDLSTRAQLAYTGGPAGLVAASHGPKVIPATGGFETARYGDKPFPIVPVDFRDRKHETRHSGDALARVVNAPDVPGSTFNLYQEMSYGQLFPFGDVPSAGIATSNFNYAPGFTFSERDLTKPTCRGATLGGLPATWGSALYPERIKDGWYQMPGDTEYYGGDFPAFTLGTGSTIDAACGDTSKSVYDAASIADPEIDYNQFDSDKDGVVDFFMMVFTGLGGNGDSQLNGVPPYDNIWPHSSSLEFSYQDEHGLAGYISDDQLTDLEGTPQCWTSADYSSHADCAAAGTGGAGLDSLPTYVRVGPYNVNPEDAIDHASVISHEYGHHLGLPDFYSDYSAYNDWNLMAGDYSQHMTIFGKQELGWVVPLYVQPGLQVNVKNWREVKNDTGQITWRRPDGTPYTLSATNGNQNIHNGQAYAMKLPARKLIDPQLVASQASAPYVWHSGRGNDFGCAPKDGHNLDLILPELESVAAGTPITVQYKSSWDIEWDFDFGFTMVTTDGANYTALPSKKGYTSDNVFNPNSSACFTTYNNGLTGQSGSYQAGTQTVERLQPDYKDGAPFLADEYDLSAYAGKRGVVLRFSYYTDPGFDRPGWFIDDLVVKAGDKVIYSSNFSKDEPLRLFPGGCSASGLKSAAICTAGWSHLKVDAGAPLDHAYYLELRDRSGFDFNGRGQSDRGEIKWEPGVLIEYTDEARGYGNNGASSPPNQHYLDSHPEPGVDCGDSLTDSVARCEDAAFTAASGDSHFKDVGWIDNFANAEAQDGFWHFDYNCLTLDVTRMVGNTGNSETLPSDLTADATLKASPGCSYYYFGQTGWMRPDLTVSKITTQRVTGGIRVAATITNIGNTVANLSTTQFKLDGSTVLGNVAMASIQPGASRTAVFTWNTSGVTGNHTINVTADVANVVYELRENNNTGQVSVTAP